MIDGATSKRRWRDKIKVEVRRKNWYLLSAFCVPRILELLSYTVISTWLSDWTTTVSQYLWGIGSRISAPQMPKSTSAQVPFCVSYHLSITAPEVLHSFCCRWESWLWLREVEQFAQSHTASKVRIEIQNPSLCWHWDSFFLYHITLLPLPWDEWSWHKVELATCL